VAKKKPEKKTYPKDVERKLTKAEAAELGPKMGEQLEVIAKLKEQKAKVTKEWQAKIDAAELELERFGNASRTGRIAEQVMVYDEADERRLEVVTKRADNDAPIDRRPMTADERQGKLPGVPDDDAESDPDGDDDDDDDDGEEPAN